ncbi:MAG: transposase [Bacteroidia bacterium]|nr:transposase [Bacteroidia bacterium]
MMKKTKRKFSAAFKTQVVLEALRERSTLSELAQKYELHPNQISTWKQKFLTLADQVFDSDTKQNRDVDKEKEEIYKQIGQMKVEIDWLKKKVTQIALGERRSMINFSSCTKKINIHYKFMQ